MQNLLSSSMADSAAPPSKVRNAEHIVELGVPRPGGAVDSVLGVVGLDGEQLHTLVGVHVAEEGADFPAEHPGQRQRSQVQHGDLHPLLTGRGGDHRADPAAPMTTTSTPPRSHAGSPSRHRGRR